jgi:hypothetical protein
MVSFILLGRNLVYYTNPLKTKFIPNNKCKYTNSVRTSHETQYNAATKTNPLMQFKETTPFIVGGHAVAYLVDTLCYRLEGCGFDCR